MDYRDLEILLNSKIEAGNEVAIPYIQTFGRPGYMMHNRVENIVYIVLKHPAATNEMVNAACQSFVDIGTSGSWVHSLSHFTEKLWEKRDQFSACIPCLKAFYRKALEMANEGNDDCCNRLVIYFAKLARFDDNPVDFFLTLDNLKWMDWQYSLYAKLRIEHGLFESLEAFQKFNILFEMRNPTQLYEFYSEWQVYVIDTEKAQQNLKRLVELGVNISEFDGLVERELRSNIKKIQGNLNDVKNLPKHADKDEWRAMCKAALAKLQSDLSNLTTA